MKRSANNSFLRRFDPRLAPWLVVGLFFILAVLGFKGTGDYGITWDEVIQRRHGMVTMDYLNELSGETFYRGRLSDYELKDYEYGYHGVLFSVLALQADIWFELQDFRTVFRVRRCFIFAVFLIGLFFMYRTIVYLLKDRWMGLLGMLMVVLTPRIYAHAHFNPKDIILMAGYMMSAYTMIRFLDHPNWRWAVIHGLACGVAVNTRILGLAIPAMTVVWFILDRIFLRKDRMSPARTAVILPTFLFSTSAFILLFWPYLWFDPIGRFIASFTELAKYFWNSEMLFMGRHIRPENLPLIYLPVWIGITVPILYTAIFLSGIYLSGRLLFRNLKKHTLYINQRQRNLFLIVGLAIGPILAVIMLGSSIYHGWRHLYFIYLPFIILTVYALKWLWSVWKTKPIARYSLAGLLALNMLLVLVFMIRNHPLQAMYFNRLAGEDVEHKFDVDYWGSSLSVLFEKVLDHSDKDIIRLAWAEWNKPALHNYYFLPEADRNRIELVDDIRRADYYISLYLWNDYANAHAGVYPMNRPALQVKIGDMRVSGAHILK